MSPIEQSIRAEQLRLLFKSPVSIIGAPLTAALSLAVLWGSIAPGLLAGWGAAMLSWTLVRWICWLRFRRVQADDALAIRWSRSAVMIMAVSGLLWGLFGAGFYLAPDTEIAAFMVLVVASMLAGGAITYAAYRPAYDAFVVGCALPVASASFSHGTQSSIVFGAMLLFYIVLLLAMGRSVSHSIERMISLQFQNTGLVDNLRHAKNAAEVANLAKTAFLANVSHELRTPLNAVLGFAGLIRDGAFGPIDARYRGYANDIHASGEHLLALISDILDLSKIEAGRFDLHEQEVSIPGVVERCLRLIAWRAEDGRVAVRNQVPADLPHLVADDRRLRQVLLNVLSNAVKFTPAGGSVEISAARSADGGTAIAVADTGVGMRPEDIPVALEPFRQLDSTFTRHYEGTGLGLPLAQRLIELHGGTLAIESAPGKGTTVTMRLPASRVIESGDAPLARSANS